MKIEFDRRFTRKLRGRFERHEFFVGVLEDKPYRRPIARKMTAVAPSKLPPSVPRTKKKGKGVLARIKSFAKNKLKSKRKKGKKAGRAGAVTPKPKASLQKLARSMGLGTMDGILVRKKSNKTRSTIARISAKVRKQVDYLRLPFKKQSKELKNFVRLYFLYASGRGGRSPVETALRFLVRQPILKRKYGPNTRATIQEKGFDHRLVDTGQLYRNTKAKVRVRRVRK